MHSRRGGLLVETVILCWAFLVFYFWAQGDLVNLLKKKLLELEMKRLPYDGELR